MEQEPKDLIAIVNELAELYKDYHSISFSVEDGRIGVRVVKVRTNNTTAAQYDYISGLGNVGYPSNSTIRNASKAAASVIISVAKAYPNICFWVEKQ